MKMNKYQIALNEISSAVLDVYAYGYNQTMEKMYKSMDLLKELVDKEMPKKPIDIEFGPCGDLMLCCPTCKHGVVPIPTYHGNKYYPRCPFCGQLLKGDEENE